MAPIHNRMPVILEPEDFDMWLDPGDRPEQGETHQDGRACQEDVEHNAFEYWPEITHGFLLVQVVVDPAVLHFELDGGHDQDDNENDPGNGRTVADLEVPETGLPEIVDHRNRGRDERLVVAIQDENRFEDLQGID